MLRYKVVMTASAELDLQTAYEYIIDEYQDYLAAASWLEDARSAINTLEIFPEGNQIFEVEPWQSLGFRSLRVRHHRIIYKVDRENLLVYVAAIKYSRMDFTQIPPRDC